MFRPRDKAALSAVGGEPGNDRAGSRTGPGAGREGVVASVLATMRNRVLEELIRSGCRAAGATATHRGVDVEEAGQAGLLGVLALEARPGPRTGDVDRRVVVEHRERVRPCPVVARGRGPGRPEIADEL